MQILIVSIIYAVAAVILLSFAVKNFLKMNDKNNQIYRQSDRIIYYGSVETEAAHIYR